MDIITKATSLKNFWGERDKHIAELYEMRRLVDTLARTGFESAVVNDPKNIIRAATYLLASSPMKHRIPSLLDEGEQEKNAVCERALTHIWRDKDRKQRLSGRRLWRWELADLLLMTGWYGVFVDVLSGEHGADFHADIWNPARMYPEFSEDGLISVCYEYDLTDEALAVKAKKLDWDLSTQNLTAVHMSSTVGLLWLKAEKVTQSALVNGKVVAERRATNYDDIPVLVGAVGGEGVWGGYAGGDTTWKKHYAESVLEPNFPEFKTYNKWLTYYMQLIRDTVQGFIKHPGGIPGSVKSDDVKSGKIVDLVQNEDLVRSQPAALPADTQMVLRVIGEKIQQGGFNWTTFGSSGTTNLSGIAISQMRTGLENIIGEQKDAIQSLVSEIDTTWLAKYKRGKFKPFMIVGKKMGIPGLVREKFTAEVVPDDPIIEAEFALAAPKDTMERITAARQAQPDGRLLDPVTVLEDILDKDDPQMILTRLDEYEAKQMPEMKTIKMIKALRQLERDMRNAVEPDAELADLIKQAWTNLLANLGQPKAAQPAEAAPGVPGGALSPEAAGKPRTFARQAFGAPAPQAGQTGLGTQPTEVPAAQNMMGA